MTREQSRRAVRIWYVAKRLQLSVQIVGAWPDKYVTDALTALLRSGS